LDIEKIARDFFRSMELANASDVSPILLRCAPDIRFWLFGPTYPPLVGHDNLSVALERLYAIVPGGVTFDIIAVASVGNRFFVERYDRATDVDPDLDAGGAGVQLCGVGTIDGEGLVTSFCDYHDPGPQILHGLDPMTVMQGVTASDPVPYPR
jgi:limonene-1,2-epoxide hydrolase